MKLLILLVTTLFVFSESISIAPRAGCSVNVNGDFTDKSPLLLNPGTVTFFRANNPNSVLNFNAGQSVHLACPGSSNYLTVLGSGNREVTVSCVDGKTFSTGSQSYAFSALTCQQSPNEEDKLSGSCGAGTLIKIGFTVAAGFVEVYDACHDTANHHTTYTKFIMTSDAVGFQKGIDRPNWVNGKVFSGIDPTTLYKRATQRLTFTDLLGSAALAEQYIHLTNDYFLSKGHMTAKADFFYGSQQLATFFYSNAAPQWQTVNGQNWNRLEENVRSLAGSTGQDLEVYTGNWGKATLPNASGVETELYLSTTRKMPVPRMFWKVVYNRSTQKGVAFVSLNNPYQSAASAASDVRCTNICGQISWVTWEPANLVKGYSYCCEVNNFRTAFPDLPAFTVTGILN